MGQASLVPRAKKMASLSFGLVPHVQGLLMMLLDVLDEIIVTCWWKLLNDSTWISTFYLEETMETDKSAFPNLSGSI